MKTGWHDRARHPVPVKGAADYFVDATSMKERPVTAIGLKPWRVSASKAVGDLRWKIGYIGTASLTTSKISNQAFFWSSPVDLAAVSSSSCTLL